MKNTLYVILIFLMFTAAAYSADRKVYTCEPDTTVCIDYAAIKQLNAYMDQNDKEAVFKLFQSGDCAIIKPQMKVYVMQEKGSYVRIRREGMRGTVWTFRGAVK